MLKCSLIQTTAVVEIAWIVFLSLECEEISLQRTGSQPVSPLVHRAAAMTLCFELQQSHEMD